MEFFQKLFDTGEVDITMRIMKKNDKLTINIMPGSQVSKLQPIIITATPAELDQEFFKTVMPDIKEIGGLVSNIADVKKEASEKAAAKPKPAEKTKGAKNKDTAKGKVKKSAKPEAKEASLFEPDADPGEVEAGKEKE